MTDLWTKKKKVFSRKERFRNSDEYVKKKEKDEDVVKQLFEKEEHIQKLISNEIIKYEKQSKEHEEQLNWLKSICEKFHNQHSEMINLQIVSRDVSTRNEHPTLNNLKRIVPWMNECISKWRVKDEKTLSKLRNEIDDCVRMLNTLAVYIENPLNIRHVENWYECKRDLRKELEKKLNLVSYEIIKDVEKKMTYFSTDIMYYSECNKYFRKALWTVLEKSRTDKDDKFPLICNFEEYGVTIQLPKVFAYKLFAVRCLVMLNDYFSADCRTSKDIKPPTDYILDFYEYHQKQWQKNETLRKQQQEEEAIIKKEMEKRQSIVNKIRYFIPTGSKDNTIDAKMCINESNITDVNVERRESQLKDTEYLSKCINSKSVHSRVEHENDQNDILEIKKHYVVQLDKFECSMRKYSITGGVYNLDLVKQPPQPKTLKDGSVIRMIIGDDNLQKWHYLETYEPPTVKFGKVKQLADDDDEDTENTPEGVLLSNLILITIKLPDHVLWFDAPLPVYWDYENNYWSTEYVYDTKFDEEKQIISFRAGKMGPFGLAVFKYNNFPFQNWELKLNDNAIPEIIFSLTTSSLILEFLIRRNEICLISLENANTSALQELIGVFYEPRILISLLKNGGVNIFPTYDSCFYIDGVQLKHFITENHLYHCMANLCLHFEFSWCRWNLMAGYKKFAMQIRTTNWKNNKQLLVTDQRCMITESTDVSQTFAECETSDSKFYPDLMNLAKEIFYKEEKKILNDTDEIFIETVYYILFRTRILSLS